MSTKKETIIDRLINDGHISTEEALELLKKDIQPTPIPAPQIPANPYEPTYHPLAQPNQRQWFESCQCNPANGGNGICGCTLGSGITY